MLKKSKAKNKHKNKKSKDKQNRTSIDISIEKSKEDILNVTCNDKDDKTNEKLLIKHLSKKIDDLSLKMEKMKFVDYVYFIEHPKKMLWANFTNGIARGFGIAIGFTILSAVTLYILKFIVTINLPYIGKFISDIVEIVQNSMKNSRLH